MINEEEERKVKVQIESWKLKSKKQIQNIFRVKKCSKNFKGMKITKEYWSGVYPMVTNDHFLNEWLLKNNENEKPKVES